MEWGIVGITEAIVGNAEATVVIARATGGACRYIFRGNYVNKR